MSTNWHHIDELRENWLLLRLGQSESSQSNWITFWELAVGNVDAVVDTTAATIPTTSDGDVSLLDDLLSTLGQYRRIEEAHVPLLITSDQATLQQLRSALLARQEMLESTTTLRGFAHLNLEEQLQEQFGQQLDNIPSVSHAESASSPRPPETKHGELRPSPRLTELWDLWEQMFALLPPEAVRGTPI
jgi:hypothetical protein